MISAYCHGSFISYDSNGNVETLSDNNIEDQIYYNHKYNMHIKSDEIKNKQDKWVNEKDEKLIDKYLSEYIEYKNRKSCHSTTFSILSKTSKSNLYNSYFLI